MDDGRVANGNKISDNTWKIIREMQHRVVLNIAVMPHHDAIDIAAQHRVIPDARIISQSDIPQHRRAARDINALAQFSVFWKETDPVAF